MRVMLDCDGVIANFVEGACRVHERPDPYDNPDNLDCGSMEKIWGMTHDEFITPMDFAFWEGLEKMPLATKIVASLETAFGRKNICILTKPTTTRGACDGKRAWIKKHFPNYADRYLLGPDKTFCADPQTILIDDNEKNCMKFIDAGGRAYMLPAPWNFKHSLEPMGDLIAFLTMVYAGGWAI